MTALSDTYSAIAELSVAFAPPPASVLAGLSDDELLTGQRRSAELARRVAALSAAYAAEIAHRSRRELGYDGLAQRLGQRNAENLVQKVTGSSVPEARSLVQAGALLPVDVLRPDAVPQPSWLAPVGEALAAGTLSVPAVEAIRVKLGGESDAVSAGDLAIAVATLLREAPGLTVEQLADRASQLRTDLDLGGVAEREEALRQKRYLKFTKLPDGMTRVQGLLDPESAAIVVPVFDTITSPRRGGPRFVDPDDVERAENLLRDPRSTEQITLDGFVDLIRVGVAADDGRILGSRKPAVHLLVTQRDLATREGVAFFAGQAEGVSLQTAERHICASGLLPILFDETGQPLKLGRTKRRFNEAQRIAIAARDGGCIFGDCTRPPSWSEAHHIDEWERDQGQTDVEDGVCLCRFHHLLLHNRGWRIIRRDGDYFLIPPPAEDPEQRPIPLRSKSPAYRRLLAHA